MAANNEITLERKRCIFVDEYIYFSNYYLKSKISEANVSVNSVNKIKFDTTEFMNKTMIQDENKKTVSNQLEVTLPNPLDLNESLYSKVNISDNTININVAENEILELKILELKIFKDIDQIRQFLQFDGWWCPEAEHTDFDERVKPASTDSVPSEPSQAGGTVSQPVVTGSPSAAAATQPAATGSQPAAAGAGWFSWVPGLSQQSGPQSGQPSAQQIGGGTKQTRSTRNHKNRKSKKN
jgi:hypothetical protein